MGLFDSIRRVVGRGDTGAETTPDDDPPELVDTRTLAVDDLRSRAEDAAGEVEQLDFSLSSLEQFDAAIEAGYDDELHTTDTPGAYDRDAVRFGCYLGEVIARVHGGEWTDEDGWGVTLTGPDDTVTVSVFEVATRSIQTDPVFAAVTDRAAAAVGLDPTAVDADRPHPDRVDGAADEPADASPDEAVAASLSETDDPEADTDEGAADGDPSPATDDSPSDGTDAGTDTGFEFGSTPGSEGDAADDPQPDDPAADTEPTAGDESVYTNPFEAVTESAPAGDDRTDRADDVSSLVDEAEPDRASAGSGANRANDTVGESPDPTEGDGLRAEYAEEAAGFVDFWSEHNLDYSPESLSRLDSLVAAEWDDDRFDDATFGSEATFDDRAFTSVAMELGSYFGEVLVRDLDAEWRDETANDGVVVESPDGALAIPVFRVAGTSLRQAPVFAKSYESLLEDIDR